MGTKYAGLKFGKLTVIDSITHITAGGHPMRRLLVRCDCGKEYEREASSVVKSKVAPMCKECRSAENRSESARGHKHPLYKVWWGMILRCHDENSQGYLYYGKRGISVCDRWRGVRPNFEFGTMDGFRLFTADMGDKPSDKHSIDRVNNDGDYSPENCRWATTEQQSNNTRATVKVTAHGRTLSISQWGRALGIAPAWATQARKHGIPLDKALEVLLVTDTSIRLDWYDVFGTAKPDIALHPRFPRSGKASVKAFISEYFRSVGWTTP